jgi:hypothetical protein
MIGKSGLSQSEVRGGVGVVGVKKACGWGGGAYLSPYEPLETLT